MTTTEIWKDPTTDKEYKMVDAKKYCLGPKIITGTIHAKEKVKDGETDPVKSANTLEFVRVEEDIAIMVPWGENGAPVPLKIDAGEYIDITHLDKGVALHVDEETFQEKYSITSIERLSPHALDRLKNDDEFYCKSSEKGVNWEIRSHFCGHYSTCAITVSNDVIGFKGSYPYMPNTLLSSKDLEEALFQGASESHYSISIGGYTDGRGQLPENYICIKAVNERYISIEAIDEERHTYKTCLKIPSSETPVEAIKRITGEAVICKTIGLPPKDTIKQLEKDNLEHMTTADKAAEFVNKISGHDSLEH